MPKKNIILLTILIFLVTSCADTWSNVKRGLTGVKQKSTDEFLVKKKDPLILPPDFENLPTPDERNIAIDENLIFKNTLEDSTEDNSSTSNSVETSILKKIQSK